MYVCVCVCRSLWRLLLPYYYPTTNYYDFYQHTIHKSTADRSVSSRKKKQIIPGIIKINTPICMTYVSSSFFFFHITYNNTPCRQLYNEREIVVWCGVVAASTYICLRVYEYIKKYLDSRTCRFGSRSA